MPRIISFAWTSAALLAGAKTVTRRAWAPAYARTFRSNELIHAYDRSPRVGGHQIARLRLTDVPRYEADADAPDSDYEAEGFAWFAAHPDALPARAREELRVAVSPAAYQAWREAGGHSWVIRFEVLP